LAGTLLLPAMQAEQHHSTAYQSAARKFAWIAKNSRRASPSTRPTVVTADEWNAYLDEGGVKLPNGLSHVRITSTPGRAQADLDVDFDRLSPELSKISRWLALFSGKYHVTATARVSASGGIAHVHIESVRFDGISIPRMALELFATHFVQPKYGKNLGLDSTFPLHHRIDTVVAGDNQVTVTQR
jgi:hypothetical protein